MFCAVACVVGSIKPGQTVLRAYKQLPGTSLTQYLVARTYEGQHLIKYSEFKTAECFGEGI